MQVFFKLLSKINNKEFSPIYLLHGEEPYFIDKIVRALINELVDESSKEFDFSIFYGGETSVFEILEKVKRYPMISEYNVVLIKEGQNINPLELDLLATYAEKPINKTIVIFCYSNKAFDMRKKFFKAVKKTGEIFNSKRIYENQLLPWIFNQGKKMKLEISPISAELMAAYIGTNLIRLEGELKKLKLLLPERKKIDREDIEKHIGISKMFNIFELQKSIGYGNFSGAFQIIQYLNLNNKKHPLSLVLGSLHNYFQKLLLLKINENNSKNIGISPFFLKEYQNSADRFSIQQLLKLMEFVLEADLDYKGINLINKSPKEILETLLIRIFSI